jgi:hypothetical protein
VGFMITKFAERGQQTPVSNTGLNSQELSKGVALRVDTLSGVCRAVPTLGDAYRIIALLEDVFADKVEFRPELATHMGRRWDGHSTTSLKGLKFWWIWPKAPDQGQLMVYLGGKVLSGASMAQAHDVLSYLAAVYGFECKRIDVAIDDFDKKTPLVEVERAAREGNYAYTNSYQVIESAKRGAAPGRTIYFGSSKSDKRIRCYDKAIESEGKIDAIRWEVQLRDEKAAITCRQWLEMTPKQALDEGPQFLASLVTGAVRLCDRTGDDPNIERCPLLSWWEDFCNRTATGLRVTLPTKTPLLERSLKWLSDQVAPTIALIEKVFGEGFDPYLQALLAEGVERHGSRHRSIMLAAAGEGWQAA